MACGFVYGALEKYPVHLYMYNADIDMKMTCCNIIHVPLFPAIDLVLAIEVHTFCLILFERDI